MSEIRAATADAHGLEMYYETSGRGEPLLLLHGALSTIDVSFGRLRPALGDDRQLIAVEQQAHGHTPDLDRPLTYPQMADDTAALVETLGVRALDVFGYSLGAGVAVELAIRDRHLVRSLILASPAISREGFYPGVLDQEVADQVEALKGTIFERAYLESAPNPAGWETLVAKCNELDRTFEGWSPASVASIDKPTLIVTGDADIIRPEHAVEMFQLLGAGETGGPQLAVLPGTTHLELPERVQWLESMIAAFLASRP